MNYEQARQYLDESMKFGSRLGLERMEALMEALGNPAMEIPCVHVAGTNGKGSVTAFTSNILAHAGYRVGIFTSPFIERFSERIRVLTGAEEVASLWKDETFGEIGDEELAHAISKVKVAADVIYQKTGDHPTEFELTTAAAFLHFQEKNCDYLVLETGLGGRLDSTNIVKNKTLTIITAIAMDHMDRLGDSLKDISREKAGIIKEGTRLVFLDPYSYTDPENAAVIYRTVMARALDQRAAVSLVGEKNISAHTGSRRGQSFDFLPGASKTTDREKIKIEISLTGDFQVYNASLAATAGLLLTSADHLAPAIGMTRWPGRFESLHKDGVDILMDGAHNPQAALALKKSLNHFYSGSDLVFLCGMMADKDYRKVLEAVLDDKSYRARAFICTEIDNPRALNHKKLALMIAEILDKEGSNGYNVKTEIIHAGDVVSALERALNVCRKSKADLVVFGSLYLAGEIRRTPGIRKVGGFQDELER